MMDWKFIGILIALLVILVIWKRLSLVSADAARQHLREGAVVVDVRSAAEFADGHLPSARNIPLDELARNLSERLPDKNQVVLLHCLSGTRSGIAERRLKQAGYTRVFNLGSLTRASEIVGQSPD